MTETNQQVKKGVYVNGVPLVRVRISVMVRVRLKVSEKQ